MSTPTQIGFTHKEVVEALLRHEGITEGIWGMIIKFGIKGANVGASDSDVMPSAIVPVLEIGLEKRDAENNLSVDAAKLSPVGGSKSAKVAGKRKVAK